MRENGNACAQYVFVRDALKRIRVHADSTQANAVHIRRNFPRKQLLDRDRALLAFGGL